jgi:DNA-binding response OmpR family regulator
MSDLAFVIEDDEDLAMIFSMALQAAEYEVETIRNGYLARERLKVGSPHIVLLDMHLPGASGADLLKQIRADERLKGVIVLLATADARLGEAYTDIADYVLIKPITFTQLLDLSKRLHKK